MSENELAARLLTLARRDLRAAEILGGQPDHGAILTRVTALLDHVEGLLAEDPHPGVEEEQTPESPLTEGDSDPH